MVVFILTFFGPKVRGQTAKVRGQSQKKFCARCPRDFFDPHFFVHVGAPGGGGQGTKPPEADNMFACNIFAS